MNRLIPLSLLLLLGFLMLIAAIVRFSMRPRFNGRMQLIQGLAFAAGGLGMIFIAATNLFS